MTATDMRSAPYDTTVEVLADGCWFPAKLRQAASMTEGGDPCDQWIATTDDHPACWSEGCCWESNVDEQMSAQPKAWRTVE